MKIDLVYLWVDGADPKWKEKKDRYSGNLDKSNIESYSDCRYVENDELKYSLRSVDKFAPWINHIFIVTDQQVPKWLDTSNPRVTIVDHTEILPNEILPVFNSTVIELGVPNITGLSEHFLYSNDDMLIAKPILPEFFFTSAGKPIIRLRKRNILYYKWLKRGSDYAQIVYSSIKAIKKDFGKQYSIAPHHNIDAYNKSTFSACLERYNKWLEKTLPNRFRSKDDIHRSIVSLYSLATNDAIQRIVDGSSSHCDSKHILIKSKDYDEVFKKNDPTLFCMNDNQGATDSDRNRAHEFLKKLFPEKSSFEKDISKAP